ncbi:hypothetical protein AwWohl_05480 [Gammaproteobacteria bacterium]|nr:hypothetical protein AwWohl_05480 [Gammaproteobacteria bacterium]
MIFGRLNDYQRNTLVSGNLAKILGFYTDKLALLQEMDSGTYPLDASLGFTKEQAFFMVMDGKTEVRSDRKTEYHHNFADIQLLLKGEEAQGYSSQLYSDLKTVPPIPQADPTAKPIDLYFIENGYQPNNHVILNVGDFVIFPPTELHQPLCAVNQVCEIKKAVFKVHKDLLIY